MKKQEPTQQGDKGTESLVKWLQTILPPAHDRAEESHDLWPAMQRRLRAESVPPAKVHVPWFDWALAGGLTLMLAAFPAWIPVVLYYL